MEIYPVKGTHDIIGLEADLYREIETICSLFATSYGYSEIRTPIMEHTNLFVRGVGESSDIVNKEMYTFLDKGDRSITLRPELTAGIMRSIVSNKLYVEANLPLKYYYKGPCFRYERPQAGRYRQFHQFGIEAIGAPSYYLDAEVISMGTHILYDLLVVSSNEQHLKVYINSLGDEESRANYKKALKEYFAKHIENMCADCKRRYEVNPLRILDCKVEEDREIIKNAPKMSDYLSDNARLYLNNVISLLKELDIEVTIDETLVRGLDYYTGVVFEYHMVNNDGSESIGALGGGGHYAKLLKEVGGPDLEGVGLAFGIERLAHVFKEQHKELEKAHHVGTSFQVFGLCEEAIEANFKMAETMREEMLDVEVCYEVKSVKSAIKNAVKAGALFCILVGEDELKRNEVTIKNLRTQEQTTASVESIADVCHSLVKEEREAIMKLRGNENGKNMLQ